MTRDEFLDLLAPTFTLAGTWVPTNYIPGEPMTADEVIAAMITNGHDQAWAEEIVRNVRRGTTYAPKGSPYFANSHRTHCHTVRYHHGDGMFTYIGR